MIFNSPRRLLFDCVSAFCRCGLVTKCESWTATHHESRRHQLIDTQSLCDTLHQYTRPTVRPLVATSWEFRRMLAIKWHYYFISISTSTNFPLCISRQQCGTGGKKKKKYFRRIPVTRIVQHIVVKMTLINTIEIRSLCGRKMDSLQYRKLWNGLLLLFDGTPKQ